MAAVLVIAVLAFLLGAAAPGVFGAPEEERAPASLIDWLVRGLVGAAVAHTALAVYNLTQQAHDGSHLGRVLLSDTMANLFTFGGILLALAGLLHVLVERSRSR